MSEPTDPTVGVVGANGQVGTELCFLLRDAGVRAVPIVRNTVGASTFRHYGFDVRIADVGERLDAAAALSDLDVVVLAAFASPVSRGEFKPRRARRTNRALVRNAVRAAPEGAAVVYLSSVAAFGAAIGVSERWWYVREKRRGEAAFEEACEARNRDGYVYRIGLVLGRNIDRTADIESELTTRTRVDVEADAAEPSNTVHTVTIADAVRACTDASVEPGTYTVVNEPQWTWRRVFEHYCDPANDVDVRFVGARDRDMPAYAGLLSAAAEYVADRKTEVMSLGVYLPDAVNQFVFNKYMQRDVGGDIESYEDRFRFHRREFDYGTAPGPTVPGMAPTTDRLDEVDYPPELFRQ